MRGFVCSGRVYLKLDLPKKAVAEFKAAVDLLPEDSRLLLSRSRIYAALGKQAETNADRLRATQLAERSRAKNPDDLGAANSLTSLLLEKATTKWQVLGPLDLKSDNRTVLTVQPDQSVLASGNTPDRDTYTFEVESKGPIGGPFRLEAIADPGLPGGGPGRADFGNFVLTDFRVTAGVRNLLWHRAFADYSQDGYQVSHAIDRNPSSGWGVSLRTGESHSAVFGADRVSRCR